MNHRSSASVRGFIPYHFSSKSGKGFTLIETMVAIAILAIALIGPFVAIQHALTASNVARDHLIASSLAQEAMEYVRAVRDNNYLNGNDWMDELSSFSCYGSAPSGFCTVDPTQGDIHTDSALTPAMTSYSTIGNVEPLYLSTNYLYNQQESGTPTRFTRTVQFKTLDSPVTQVRVSVTVSWITARQPYSITVTDVIADWL